MCSTVMQIFSVTTEGHDQYSKLNTCQPAAYHNVSFCPQCPVYDLDNNVAFIGMYQTMTKKGAITVQVTPDPV